MARARNRSDAPTAPVISIIGPGMRVVGDCSTEGTLRIEGEVEGRIHATKAVVVGKDGVVQGDVITQDAVIAGEVRGSVLAASRLEVHATAMIEGDIRARRLQLEDGALVNGSVQMGEIPLPQAQTSPLSREQAEELEEGQGVRAPHLSAATAS